MPIKKSVKSFPRGTALMALCTIGTAHKKEMLIRRQANSTGLKPINPFLMSIYDEPQIKVSSVNKIQF